MSLPSADELKGKWKQPVGAARLAGSQSTEDQLPPAEFDKALAREIAFGVGGIAEVDNVYRRGADRRGQLHLVGHLPREDRLLYRHAVMIVQPG